MITQLSDELRSAELFACFAFALYPIVAELDQRFVPAGCRTTATKDRHANTPVPNFICATKPNTLVASAVNIPNVDPIRFDTKFIFC